MELSKPQIEMLRLHTSTSEAKPRRNPCNGQYFRKVDFFNSTANALRRRLLLDYRGFDGKTPGGWFITKQGRAALRKL